MSCNRIKNGEVSSSLEVYQREIGTGSLLTAAEERSLANAVAVGYTNAHIYISQSNLRLVVSIARASWGGDCLTTA
jgi:DNA-directed RNA polymerase sigma subunit (sigma70/sigma32)